MRRVLALLASVALAASLSIPGLAAAPAITGTGFVGSFDTVVNGAVVGHIDAQIWPSSPNKAVSGWYSSRTADGRISTSAQVGANSFYRGEGYNEVWFNALEFFAGGGSSIFTGHFRDYLDPSVPDVVAFFGRPINDIVEDGAAGAWLGDLYEFHFTVGRGAFVLTIR